MHLVSLLEPGIADSVSDISILKEKFSRFIVYQSETDSSDFDTVPLAGEIEGAVSEVLDKRDCCQYLFPVVNPRKRKESLNNVENLSVPHGVIMQKKRAFLEDPTNTDIWEYRKELEITLSRQLANLSLSSIETDVPAWRDLSIAKITNHMIDAEGSNRTVALKDGIRTIKFLLKPRLPSLSEMLGIPENVNSVADMFLDHIMKSHKAMLAPFIIPWAYLEGQPSVPSKYISSSLNKLHEHFLHWLEIAKRIFSPSYLPRLGYWDPPSTVATTTHQEQGVPQGNKLLKHKIERVCARRQNELRTLQKDELLDLERFEQREGRCHWRAHDSVVKHMRTIAMSDMSNTLLEKIIQRFKAFQEHMACQRRRLKSLQGNARALEKSRKEEWFKMVESGELEESFDFSQIPLPGSGFVFEKFDWVCGEKATECGASSPENVSKKLDCGQPTVGDLSSVVAGALTNMEEPPNMVQQHDEPVGRQSNMDSINTSLTSRSKSAILNSTMQQESEASPPVYTGASAVSHGVGISQQLNTNATSSVADETPVNLEQLPDCDDMLLPDCDGMLIEPVEGETNTGFVSNDALLPDIGVSVPSRADVLSELSSDFLEMSSFTVEVFPNGLNPEPLANELTRITHMISNLTKKYEEKTSRLRLQREREVESIKRKYEELNKEEDATFQKHDEFLRGLARKVEGGQVVQKKVRTFKIASESDAPLQGWTRLPSPETSPTPSHCQFLPLFTNCTSFELSSCTPPLQITQAPPLTTNHAPLTNQAPSVQTNLAPLLMTNQAPPVPSNLTSTCLSASPALPISGSLGPPSISIIQMSHISSNQPSTVPTNLARTPVSTIDVADVPASLGPHISHIGNLQAQTMRNLPVLNNQHMLNPNTLGMPPSTSWAPQVQKTRAPIASNFSAAPVSPFQLPHFRADMTPPHWTSLSRPTSTCWVQPIRTSIPCALSNMGAPTTSPLWPPHVQINGFSSIPCTRAPPVLTNQTPVQTGSQRASNSRYMLRAPNICHHRPQMLISRPGAPQAPLSDLSYSVHNFSGSLSDPARRSG